MTANDQQNSPLNQAAETLRELMAAYDETRAQWIEENGTDAGFDNWFSDQVMNNRKRHGGAYDRGAADRYYCRHRDPHLFEGGTHCSDRIEADAMTAIQLADYEAGFSGSFLSPTKNFANGQVVTRPTL